MSQPKPTEATQPGGDAALLVAVIHADTINLVVKALLLGGPRAGALALGGAAAADPALLPLPAYHLNNTAVVHLVLDPSGGGAHHPRRRAGAAAGRAGDGGGDAAHRKPGGAVGAVR